MSDSEDKPPQPDQPAPRPPDIMSDDRILLAWQRTHMANERTFLSWSRTSISLLAFGFVVEKFDLFLLNFSAYARKIQVFVVGLVFCPAGTPAATSRPITGGWWDRRPRLSFVSGLDRA